MPDVILNSKARRDYHIIDTYDAGIVLKGTEVKSIRAGKAQIRDAFARIENNEVWLYNAHIEEYHFGNILNHKPTSPRKLLLNKTEIRKLLTQAAIEGHTLIPLSFHWKNGKVKCSLGVGKGKVQHDKRQDIRTRELDRELKRATMHRSKGK